MLAFMQQVICKATSRSCKVKSTILRRKWEKLQKKGNVQVKNKYLISYFLVPELGDFQETFRHLYPFSSNQNRLFFTGCLIVSFRDRGDQNKVF